MTILAIRTAFKYRLKVVKPEVDLEQVSACINIVVGVASYSISHREMQWFEAGTCALFVLSTYYIMHRLCGGDYLVAVSGQVLVFIVIKYACSGFTPLFALTTELFIFTVSLEIMLLITFIYSVYMSWQDTLALGQESLVDYKFKDRDPVSVIDATN